MTLCGRFTHAWVKENRGIDMRPDVIDVSDPAPTRAVVPVPAGTGYGTEEDSLGSVYHLVPKVPKKDVTKLMKYADVVLRFEAVFKDPSPVDAVRKFSVSWYELVLSCLVLSCLCTLNARSRAFLCCSFHSLAFARDGDAC